MSYPRKGSISLVQMKTLLGVEPMFNALSATEKLAFINIGVQQVCNFRNINDKEDYLADSISVSTVIDTSNIKICGEGQNLAAVQATISGESASNRFVILFYPGASIGAGWIADPYITVIFMGDAAVNLDFEDANFTNGVNSLYQLNCIGADFTDATIPLTADEFKNLISAWDSVTTIWTDGNAIGA